VGGQSSLLVDWLAGCVGGDGHDEEIDGCGRADEVCCVVGSRQGLSKCAGRVTSGEGLRGHAGEVRVDVAQVGDHPFADVDSLDLAELECECVDDASLLDGGLAAVELACLAVVISEALRSRASLVARLARRERPEAALGVLALSALGRRSTSSARS
jgi:hypothetical protein